MFALARRRRERVRVRVQAPVTRAGYIAQTLFWQVSGAVQCMLSVHWTQVLVVMLQCWAPQCASLVQSTHWPPALQCLPLVQLLSSPMPPQLTGQLPGTPKHLRKPMQAMELPVQAPLPLQVRAWKSSPSQASGQSVPLGACWQPRAPLHLPVLPHTLPPVAHMFLGSSAPAGMGEQLPTLPLTVQLSQLPSQALLQQTFSTHRLEAHSPFPPQIAPLALGAVHMLLMQTPWAQSVLFWQLVAQVVPLHR
jgi:hypothetical protein